MKLFVPGRICLFGEHTDWAGGYRRINGELGKGYTIICGTNQGLYADVKPHPGKLILRSRLAQDGGQVERELPMESGALLEEAQQGGLFSYAAGVAHQVMTHYRVRGLVIDNYKSDLPIKKGLSSSAAICVLVARAFNRVYDLKMTVRGEMEFAYMGETTTPSRCGRMDQGCAYGNRPVLMTFDGERMAVDEISVRQDMHFIIVDLQASKDTKEILNRLNHCYPFADDELQRRVQEYLGKISSEITAEASDALRAGDAVRVGDLMRKAQALFDEYVAPACPTQLTSPVLHKILAYEPLQPFVLGGKGVGSQGDGTAQFVCRDEASREQAIQLIEEQLRLPCLRLTLHSGRSVRKAVIPAAGFGTRLFPATKAVKKELFPILDAQGMIKPVILAIVEEALAAGIEEICILVQSRDLELFEDFFGQPPAIENFNKLSAQSKAYCDELMEIGRHVTFICQDIQDGFGHAVYCARDWVGDEPFLLLLGDHLYRSSTECSCTRQVLDVYEQIGQSVVGLKQTPGETVHHFGCVAGTWRQRDSLLSITEFREKPDLDYARKQLVIDGLPEDRFLTVFGLYVLQPQIFEYLEENIEHNVREGGEFQLTSCLDKLRREGGMLGCVVQGERFDVGLPESYRSALMQFGAPLQT